MYLHLVFNQSAYKSLLYIDIILFVKTIFDVKTVFIAGYPVIRLTGYPVIRLTGYLANEAGYRI